MVEKTNGRNSSIELMRIISMLFIIIYHVNLHCGFNNLTGSSEVIVILVTSLIVVHVNSYVLITGYYQSTKELKVSNVLKLINITWFYKVLFLFLFLYLIKYTGIPITSSITTVDIIKTLMPLDYGIYWYIDCYLVLYIISPILNIVIHNTDKKRLRNIIIILFLIFSVVGTFGVDEIVFTGTGRTLVSFILLYFIGAYLRKYPLKNSRLLKGTNNRQQRNIYIFGYLFFAFATFLLKISSKVLFGCNILLQEIGNIMAMHYLSFISPTIIITSIFYFLIFTTFKFNNKIINFISKYMIGVYLIHENKYVYENLYNWLGLVDKNLSVLKLVIVVFSLSIAIMIVSLLIDIIRKLIFDFIAKRKVSIKIRESFKKYFSDIKLNINW